MNVTQWFTTEDDYLEYEGDWSRSPFDNFWYKTLMITLYSIVCVGCIVGRTSLLFSLL